MASQFNHHESDPPKKQFQLNDSTFRKLHMDAQSDGDMDPDFNQGDELY